jgi:hypothetical protein
LKVGHVKDKVEKVAEMAEGKTGKIIDKAMDASSRKQLEITATASTHAAMSALLMRWTSDDGRRFETIS